MKATIPKNGKKLRLISILLVSAITFVPVKSYASEEAAYWYGFYVGIATATCELNKASLLRHDDTKDFLAGAFELNTNTPISARNKALEEIDSQYSQFFAKITLGSNGHLNNVGLIISKIINTMITGHYNILYSISFHLS